MLQTLPNTVDTDLYRHITIKHSGYTGHITPETYKLTKHTQHREHGGQVTPNSKDTQNLLSAENTVDTQITQNSGHRYIELTRQRTMDTQVTQNSADTQNSLNTLNAVDTQGTYSTDSQSLL